MSTPSILAPSGPEEQQQLVTDLPLCVDLDGTLVVGDVALDALAIEGLRHPVDTARLLFRSSRVEVKRELSRRTPVDPRIVPLRADVLQLIREAKSDGRSVELVTGADREVAEAIAARVPEIDVVLASDANTNLVGSAKADLLVTRHGAAGFDYVGDASADLPVWRAARTAYAVDVSARRMRRYRTQLPKLRELSQRLPIAKALLRSMRPHQWSKNALVFVPLLTSQKLFDWAKTGRAAVLFAAFCLIASSVYLLNDVLDVNVDRRHATKRNRPIASGALSIPHAIVASFGLLLLGAFTAAGLGVGPVGVLLGYYVLTLAYSLELKRRLLGDVAALTGLYTIRVAAGGAATGIALSHWLIGFTGFFFLGLALLKRYVELRAMATAEAHGDDNTASIATIEKSQLATLERIPGRAYSVVDLQNVGSFGRMSGVASVILFALYTNSAQSAPLYPHQGYLMIAAFTLLGWVLRLWILADRNELPADPVAFAISDKTSYGLFGIVILSMALAGGAIPGIGSDAPSPAKGTPRTSEFTRITRVS